MRVGFIFQAANEFRRKLRFGSRVHPFKSHLQVNDGEVLSEASAARIRANLLRVNIDQRFHGKLDSGPVMNGTEDGEIHQTEDHINENR